MQVSIQLKDAIGCEVTVAGYIAAWVKANTFVAGSATKV